MLQGKGEVNTYWLIGKDETQMREILRHRKSDEATPTGVSRPKTPNTPDTKKQRHADIAKLQHTDRLTEEALRSPIQTESYDPWNFAGLNRNIRRKSNVSDIGIVLDKRSRADKHGANHHQHHSHRRPAPSGHSLEHDEPQNMVLMPLLMQNRHNSLATDINFGHSFKDKLMLKTRSQDDIDSPVRTPGKTKPSWLKSSKPSALNDTSVDGTTEATMV